MALYTLDRNKYRCWNDIDFKKTEYQLLTSPILTRISIEEYLKIKQFPGNPEVFILFFKNGLKGVLKPNRSDYQMYFSVMAYRFSQFMEWKLIPPTVVRTIKGETGSVQLFIESKTFNKQHLSPIQKSNIFIHYFVTGNKDAKQKHILIGKNCRMPALIDNETAFLNTYIQYGDYPFIQYPIKNLRFALSNIKDYEKFPINKIQSVNLNQVNSGVKFLKKTFVGLSMEDLNDLSRMFFDKYSPQNLYFVKWKNSYWIKFNLYQMHLISKEFLPRVFQKKTICKLKSLNSNVLNSFLPSSAPFSLSKETIFSILYRRDIILKEAKKFGVDCVL